MQQERGCWGGGGFVSFFCFFPQITLCSPHAAVRPLRGEEALPPPAQDAPEVGARRWVPGPGLCERRVRRGPGSPSGSAGLREPPPLPGSARGP